MSIRWGGEQGGGRVNGMRTSWGACGKMRMKLEYLEQYGGGLGDKGDVLCQGRVNQ